MDLDPSLERMRALLSSYYGVQDESESGIEDAKDIDCATFDMVRALLHKSSLFVACAGAVGYARCLWESLAPTDLSRQEYAAHQGVA